MPEAVVVLRALAATDGKHVRSRDVVEGCRRAGQGRPVAGRALLVELRGAPLPVDPLWLVAAEAPRA